MLSCPLLFGMCFVAFVRESDLDWNSGSLCLHGRLLKRGVDWTAGVSAFKQGLLTEDAPQLFALRPAGYIAVGCFVGSIKRAYARQPRL